MGKTIDYFTDWLTQTVNYGKQLSMDGVGQITYASDVELDCYTHGTVVEVVNDKGEKVLSNQQIYLNGENAVEAAIDFGDRFKIDPDNEDSRYRPVKSIDKFYDEDGVLDLVVVYL